MAPKAPQHMIVVKKEDKEPKLRALIADALAGPLSGKPAVLRLLVRSTSSPAAKAVVALQGELAAAGFELLVVTTTVDVTGFEALADRCTIRLLSDIRCHDAHELMVIDENAGWVGDCLRRDPATRDSFELHAGGSGPMAGLLTLSFNRLWAMSQPHAGLPPRPSAEEVSVAVAALAPEEASRLLALTRH